MTGNQSCAKGHIGALCEACDIEAVKWEDNWSNSANFKCGSCQEVASNSIKIAFITIYTLVALLFSVKSTKAIVEDYLLVYYLQKMGFITLSQ